MAVNSETIEIRLSGLDRIRELERRLLSIEGIANSLSGAIDEVGTGLQRDLSALQRNVREARALRTTRAAAQDVLNNPRAARALGRTGRRQLQEQIERQGRLLSDVYEPAIRSLGQAVREGRAQQRAMQTQRRQVASLTTGMRDDITQTYSQLGDTQEQVIRQLRGTRRRTRVAGTRALIEARRDDARRLAGSSNLLTGNLVQRDRNITAQTAAVNRRIDTLERSELSARRAAGAQARSLRRQQTVARSSGDIVRVGDLQNEIQEIGRNLARELDTLQSTRSSLATELGRLNQGRRSLGAISRGRSTVSRAGESIRRRARELEEVYGVRPSELSVNIGGRQTRIDQATRRAGLEANVRDNIEGAKTILGLASRRLTFLERELGLNNKIQDAEQKRANTLQQLGDRLQSLRASRASGPQMQNFENLLGQLQQAANTRNMPRFNRLAASAKAAADSAASALATEQKRQNLLTQNNKALRSIDLSQSQLSELQSRGAGNLLSFQTAQTAASRLPQLQQAGNFDEFRLALTDFTAALRIARGELSARQRNFTGGQRLQGILGEFDAILSQLPANARIRGGVESRRRAFGASGAAALQAGDVAGFNIEATSAAKRTAELRTQVQNEKRRLDLISSGQKKEQELLALQSKGVNVTALLGTLRSAIARAQQVSYEFIARETNELDRQVASSKRLLLVENQRLKAAGSGTQSPTALIDRVAKLGGRFSSLVGGGAVPENLVAPIRKSLIGIAAAAKQGTTPLDELKTRLDRLSTRISSFKTISGTVQDPSTLINQVAKAGTKFSGLVSGGAVPSNLVKPLRDALTGIASSARNGSRPISELKGELDRLLTRISAFRLPTAAQDPTALISRIGKAGAKFTDLVGAGAVPQNLVDPIRKSLREIGSAARQGSTPLSELAARLTKLSARISSFTKPSTADPTSIIKGVSSFGASLSGIQSSGLVADSTISNLRKSLIDIAKAARSGSAPLDKLKSDLASLGVSITSLGQNVKRSQRGIDVQLEKILGAAAIGGPLGRGRTGQQALDAIGAIPGVNLARPSMMSTINIEKVAAALGTLRNGLDRTSAEFKQLDPVLRRLQKRLADQASRRDPNADFLTRGLGQRNAQGLSEGIIGGAFPLLFGQGLGASIGGGLGGFLGGRAGGMLGFGLSLVGTAIGSQVDALMQATQDTGNMLRDLVGNFEQIKESGLLASRSQEKLIGNLLEAGNKTAAYAIIQDELNRKLGVDGAAKLREAADAGDRLKRAMADLGVQIQLLIAGPLTDLLNKISGAISRDTEEQRFKSAFEAASPEAKRAAETQINPSRNPKNKSFFSRISDTFFLPATGLESLFSLFGGPKTPGTSAVPIAKLREVTAGLQSSRPQRQPTPQEQRDAAIRSAEDLRDQAQRQLDASTKRSEGADILKGFKQQANAVRREQEDIDRQSFELRRDYEKQIEDIRRGVEEKITQIRQENAQKELEILVKQGQLREQQFKNAALAVRNELAGDELAQNLADAVTSYLGAQLSAQDQLEQRRKQFEIEISNQQIELEKYKGEIARNVAQLNLSTAEKIQEINRSVARRNEDAALNTFEAEKKIAKLKAEVIQNELLVMQARQKGFLEQSKVNAGQNPGKQLYSDILKADQAIFDNITENLKFAGENLKAIEATQAPPKLREVAPVSAKGVSTAGVTQAVARGSQLQKTLLDLELALINSNEVGNFNEFIGRISDLAKGPFQELENSLTRSKKALGMAADDSSIAIAIIQNSYENLVGSLAKQPKIEMTPELQRLLSTAEKVTIEFEKLRPTIEFYTQSNDQLSNSITQARDDIASLLQPVGEYDKWLQIINSRGGLGINPEQEQQILKNAKALDNLNAKLKVLNGLRDIASGWTDSFIQLNKELLKGGNLLESVKRFAEGVADRTLDVILEFTLRPLQDKLFKNLADILGIKPEQNPLLQPINAVKENTDKLLQAAIELVKRAQAAAPPAAAAAPANGIVPGPGGRQLPSEPPKGLQWYQGAQPSAAPTGQFTGIGGPDLPMTGRSIKEALRLTDEEIAAAVNTAIGEYSGSDPLGRTDVFANILSRSRSGQYPKNLVDVVTQAGQYAPNFGLSRAQVVNPSRYGAELFNKVKSELLDPALLERSIRDVNGRLYFKGVSQYGNMMQGDFLRAEGQNFFHGPGREPGLNPQITSRLLSEIGSVMASAQSPQFNPEARAKEWINGFIENRKLTEDLYNSEFAASNKATESMNGLSASAQQAAGGLDDFGTQMSDSVTKFQKTVGTGLQAISSIAMGIGGAQMIRKGGAYNTLMGAASIFGSISSITGMFGTGGGLSGLFGRKPKSSLPGFTGEMLNLGGLGLPGYASGGRPDPYDPAIIGENGPELWVPDRPGTIIPNDELYVPGLDDKGGSAPSIGRYARRAASSMESGDGESGDTIYTGNYGRAVPYQRSETTREIDRLERITTNPKELPPIKYETTRVNEYDFVTPEQLEASNARTAKIARNQTIRELADSMKTRKRLGL